MLVLCPQQARRPADRTVAVLAFVLPFVFLLVSGGAYYAYIQV
jgi:hypothetical protein